MPFDGEPHAEHAPVVLGLHPLQPNWEAEQQGAANNLGVFGGNPHPDAIQLNLPNNAVQQNHQPAVQQEGEG